LEKSIIILAFDDLSGLQNDAIAAKLGSKPLIRHVVDAVKGLAEQVIVVASSQDAAEQYAKVLPKAKFAITQDPTCPVAYLVAGLSVADGDYSLILPFNAPFVSKEVASLLFDCGYGKTAAIVRRTSQEVEVIPAVYQTKTVLEEAKKCLQEGECDLLCLVERLRGVRFISTLVLDQIDPELRSFFTVNTPIQLKKAESMLTGKKK
jgi:molybdopterin-guanine dinucleotide biosynthesis protein A